MKIIIITLILALAACATPINERNAHDHANAAVAAQQSGDWDLARKHWAKATVNAELAGMPDSSRSIAYYNYGRSLGVTCFFSDSEAYLNKSLEIDKSNNGPVHMPLLELARLNYDQNKYAEAASYYEQLIPIYKQNNAEGKDPAGVSLVYKEYSQSLNGINDKDTSALYMEKANSLKRSKTSSAERTPYGKHCSSVDKRES